MERLHTLRAEELQRADLAELSPVVAVRRERDVGAVVGHDLDCHQLRAGGEGGIMRLHDLSGDVGRGNDNGGDLAELQVHDWPVFDGQVSETNVG